MYSMITVIICKYCLWDKAKGVVLVHIRMYVLTLVVFKMTMKMAALFWFQIVGYSMALGMST